MAHVQTGGKKSRLTLYIFIGLFLGIGVGVLLNKSYVNTENEGLQRIDKERLANDEILKKLPKSELETDSKNNLEVLQLELEKAKKKANGDSTVVSENKELTVREWENELKRATLMANNDTLAVHKTKMNESRDTKLQYFTALSENIFLRLIKMIVALLVFSTLVVGVARLGDIKAVGRIGGKTLLWFISASFVSLLLGMVLVNLFKPGLMMDLPLPDVGTSTGVEKVALSFKEFLNHVFPKSPV
ncbi:MAG: dicarboxylate/amino acid:cation symporter, partial [Flavobacteriia bacterium]|nr:dicarboxylate/amino acid:cation symporter [Flavobacteriia bacterium]